MKNIYLVRHAKSSWEFELSDFDRPLNERGHSDAKAMAQLFGHLKADFFITSSAQRTISTAHYFAHELQFNENLIKKTKDLYLASKIEILNQIQNLDNQYNTVFLFGHNPGISDFTFDLAENGDFIGEMPTCSVIHLEFKENDWKKFSKKTTTLKQKWCPKKDLSPA